MRVCNVNVNVNVNDIVTKPPTRGLNSSIINRNTEAKTISFLYLFV